MRPSAGVAIDSGDLDQANVAGVPLRQSPRAYGERRKDLGADPSGGHRAGGAYFGGDGLFQRGELVGRDSGHVELDVRHLRPQVKGRGGPPEALLGHGGQEVLAGVLLHVVEPARPVQLDPHAAGRRRPGQHVPDLPPHCPDVFDGNPVDPAAVGRLAAPLGIQDRIRQDDERAGRLLPALHDLGLQHPEERVTLVGRDSVHAHSLRIFVGPVIRMMSGQSRRGKVGHTRDGPLAVLFERTN